MSIQILSSPYSVSAHASKAILHTGFRILDYHIAGKFGGGKVWWIYSFWAFGKKKFGEWIDSAKRL